METLVKSCNVCWFWSGMPNVLQKNKLQMSLGKVELYCLFVACSYTPGKLQCYYVVLAGYGSACPRFSEITNH